MWSKWGFIGVLFSLSLVLGSCGSSKTIATDIESRKLESKAIVEALDSIHRARPSFLSTRIDTKYSSKKQNVSFKANLKVNADTAVHALISYAGIPLVTAMITPDSVKVSNKKEKCYILQDLNFFKEQFGIDFTYQNLEELLLGMPINFSREQTYFANENTKSQEVYTTILEHDGNKLHFYYTLTSDLKHLKKVAVQSEKDEVTIEINYSDYWDDVSYNCPKHVFVTIKSPKNKITLNLNYDKVELNNPKEMIIVIPESYESCK
ncbi:MAG TPA: DUF4292 domain-containing protein [Taishania sp.]|nr:DUF4292 domain-containing protein [Taishania sp.]